MLDVNHRIDRSSFTSKDYRRYWLKLTRCDTCQSTNYQILKEMLKLTFLILEKSFIKSKNIKDQICCTDRLHSIVSRVKHKLNPWARFEHTTSVVTVTDYIGSCKSNYHTITTTTAPVYDMRQSSNFIDNIRVNFVVIVINHVLVSSMINHVLVFSMINHVLVSSMINHVLLSSMINHAFVSSNHSDSSSLGSKMKRWSPTILHIVNINISS